MSREENLVLIVDALRRQIRLRIVARGLAATGLLLAGLGVAGIGLDYLLLWGRATRVTYAVLAGVWLLGVLRRQLWVPLRVGLPERDLVLAIEERIPDAADRLITWYELKEGSGGVGSERARSLLRAELASCAQELAGRGVSARLFEPRAVWGRLAALGACALLLAGALFSPAFRYGLGRWDLSKDPRWTRLFLDPVPAAIGQGQMLTLSGRVEGRVPGWAAVRIRFASGLVKAERARIVGGRFEHALAPAAESFRFQLLAGDAESAVHPVRVLRKPVILSVQVALAPPAYSGRPASVQAQGDVAALAGTQATVRCSTDIPVRSARLQFSGGASVPMEVDAGSRRCAGSFPIAVDGTYSILVEDLQGLANDPPTYRVRMIPDRPPQVRWVRPAGRDLKGTPGARLRLRYSATDDIGVARVGLMLAQMPDAGAGRRQDLALTAGPEQEALLDLAAFQAREGDLYEFHLEAEDGRTPEPNRAASGPVRLRVASPAEVASDIDAALVRLRGLLEDALDRWTEADLVLGQLASGAGPPGEAAGSVAARQKDAGGLVSSASAELGEQMLRVEENGLAGQYPMSILGGAAKELARWLEDLFPRVRVAAQSPPGAPVDWAASKRGSEEARSLLREIRAKLIEWEDFNGLVRLAGRSVRDQEAVVRALEEALKK